MDAALATSGGVASRIITDKVCPLIPGLKEHKKFFPIVSFLTGAYLMDSSKLHYVGVGMAAVAGTDLASEFIPMLKYNGGAITGIEDDMAKQMADELEKRLAEDVNSAAAAMNEDVNRPGANMNGIEERTDERLMGVDGVDGMESVEGVYGIDDFEDDDMVLATSQKAA